nr:lipoprotein signal peptidase [Neisseria dumasiana]
MQPYPYFKISLRPLPHRQRISALYAARSLAPSIMSALTMLLRLELHSHLGGTKHST